MVWRVSLLTSAATGLVALACLNGGGCSPMPRNGSFPRKGVSKTSSWAREEGWRVSVLTSAATPLRGCTGQKSEPSYVGCYGARRGGGRFFGGCYRPGAAGRGAR